MSPAHVLEPTYRRLKRALMAGTWPPGAKLEALRLADDFGVSMTPVRDSLNQLAGEGLVDLTPGEGFRVAAMNEQALRDMLHVNASLLEAATDAGWKQPDRKAPVLGDDYADRVATAFAILAGGSGNRFLAALVDAIGERLHPVRQREPEIVPSAFETLVQIEEVLGGSAAERRDVVWRYHRQCAAHAASLIELIAQ